MRLFIAEKPSLARALADVLPKPHKKGDGCILLGNGDVVSWCVGHLLELAEPDQYNSIWKQWKREHLPMVPEAWKLVAKPRTRSQLAVLKHWIKSADEIVHVGDPDREGQLLVDEVIHHCGVRGAKLAAVKRCLINDLNPAAVTQAVNNLRENRDFIALSTSALARLRADWLYGINLTRLCTLLGKQAGFQGVLSVGRVQTPILGLIVRRDVEIEQFTPRPFYELFAVLREQQGCMFSAKWHPSDACKEFQDEDGRVLSRKLVENVASRIAGQAGLVKLSTKKTKHQPPPLPFNLSSLQVDAAKLFGFSAKTVLDGCQALYERHKLITYPRSDCRYLPLEHFQQSSAVAGAVMGNNPEFAALFNKVDLKRKSKAWDDKKVSAHHAIIPTAKKAAMQGLSAIEQKLYELIARQYLMQFLPDMGYVEQQIHVDIGGGLFIAKSKWTTQAGWKEVLVKPASDESSAEQAEPLPNVKVGDSVHCEGTEIKDKMTSPPKPFNDASLMSALTGIARYVSNAEIRKILRDTDGLGTEATRASIIELLFTRGFIERSGKNIVATALGRQFIQCLPMAMSLPDMTAQWENQLAAIQDKSHSYGTFMSNLLSEIGQLIPELEAQGFSGASLKEFNTKSPSGKKKGRSSQAKHTFSNTTKSLVKKPPRVRKSRVKTA